MINRKRYIRWVTYGVLFALSVWSLIIEPRLLHERQFVLDDVNWRGAPVKIAFVADLHVGAPHSSLEQLDGLVEKINAARPDLILLGGDFVVAFVIGGQSASAEEIAARLAHLTAPLGVFAVLGNHDWWHDGPGIREALEKHGIQVLENEAVVLRQGDNPFVLVGIGDDMTGHAQPERAQARVPGDLPMIVMMHDPANYPELNRTAVLALAGHTHAGQVRLPFIGALLVPGRSPRDQAYGWVHDGLMPMYVTSGVGTSILPVCFMAPPEFVVIRLTAFPDESEKENVQ